MQEDLVRRPQFLAPSRPLDAVLIFTEDGQALVTLHQNAFADAELRLWKDNNGDGFIDGSTQTLLATGFTSDPKGLAVDENTGRLFVSGSGASLSEVRVLLDGNGDRIAESPAAQPYVDGADAGALLGSDAGYRTLHFEPKSRTLHMLVDVTSPVSQAVLCAKETWGPQTQPTSLGIFQNPVPTSEHIYAKQKDASTIVVWLTDSFFSTYEYQGSPSNCSPTPGVEVVLIGRSSAARRSVFHPSIAICTVVFKTKATRIVVTNLNWDSLSFTDGVNGSPQLYDLRATKSNAPCQNNPATSDAMLNTTANGTGFVDWGAFGTPVSPTQWRGRLICSWESTPDTASCCMNGRVSAYTYLTGAASVNPLGACARNSLPLPSGTFPGGRFEEITTCEWNLAGGNPVDTKATAPAPWGNAFNGTQFGCTAPFPFNFKLDGQENIVTRTNGGRTDGEGTYQKVFIEVDCKL